MDSELSAINTDYGNWISLFFMKWLYAFCAIIAILNGLQFYFFVFSKPLLAAGGIALFVLFLAFTIYMQLCHNKFSFTNGMLMNKIHKFLVDHLFWNGQGRLLDVGCGTGALSVRCAKRYAQAEILGVDNWGKDWSYGKNQCDTNANAEGIGIRAKFEQGSLVKLVFEDASFDAVVSNFVFHKVRAASDKRQLVREALRVVRKGGSFAFQDMFAQKKYYGNMEDFVEELRKEGITEVHYMHRVENVCGFIPYFVRAPWVLRGVGLLYGVR